MRIMWFLLIGTMTALVFAAQARKKSDISKARVRYMVNDLDPAVKFYTAYLGFRVEREAKPNFAMLSRGSMELVLSTPFGPGGAAKPMLDERKAEPGGWNGACASGRRSPGCPDLAFGRADGHREPWSSPENIRNNPGRNRFVGLFTLPLGFDSGTFFGSR